LKKKKQPQGTRKYALQLLIFHAIHLLIFGVIDIEVAELYHIHNPELWPRFSEEK